MFWEKFLTILRCRASQSATAFCPIHSRHDFIFPLSILDPPRRKADELFKLVESPRLSTASDDSDAFWVELFDLLALAEVHQALLFGERD